MNLLNSSSLYKIINNITKRIFLLSLVILLVLVSYILARVFICDLFYIPTSSMEPTLIPGDKIFVNKLIFGARIYKKYNFRKEYNLDSWRVYGFRGIKPNDIIVFNAPVGYKRNKIEFNISYVYCKRCIGTPGDTITIRNGYFYNNNFLWILGNIAQQNKLSNTNLDLINSNLISTIPHDSIDFNWTIKDMGPLWIPSKGDTINLNAKNYKLYSRIIAYELNSAASFKGDTLIINDIPINKHVFINNYYFACGDNVLNSGDSRYWGFIPEDFIIGVATKVLYSREKNKIKRKKGRIWIDL